MTIKQVIIGSIQNILKKIGEDSVITSDKDEIDQATKLILPGVGTFDAGMKNLSALDLIDVLNKKVLVEKTPVLGNMPWHTITIKGKRRRVIIRSGMD